MWSRDKVEPVAFDELELKRIERTVGELCRKCSPPEHADELRTVYEVEGHSVTMYEERPPWDGVGEWTRRGIARFRFYRSRDEMAVLLAASGPALAPVRSRGDAGRPRLPGRGGRGRQVRGVLRVSHPPGPATGGFEATVRRAPTLPAPGRAQARLWGFEANCCHETTTVRVTNQLTARRRKSRTPHAASPPSGGAGRGVESAQHPEGADRMRCEEPVVAPRGGEER